MKKELHPSVEKFKEFVKANPKIVREVREGKATWQELFEEWYLLGEDDSRWDDYRQSENLKKTTAKTSGNMERMGQVLNSLKKMDPEQLQGFVANLSQALGAIQGVISQFQSGNTSNPPHSQQQIHQPFQFRKD